MKKTIIVGGGLAGLSAAYHLRNVPYEIFEKDTKVGGLCKTENIDNFYFDCSIHLLYSKDEYVTKLILSLLGHNFNSIPREAWIYTNKTFTRYPFQANTYGLPVEIVKECLLGLIKAKYELNGKKPRNFEEWITNTFGEGIAKHFMIPYNYKIWAIPLTKMNTQWVVDRIPIPKINEVVEGALRKQEKEFGPNARFWYPIEGGIEAVPRSFLPYIKNLNLNSEVTKIDLKFRKVFINDKDKRDYNYLISTLPLPQLINIMKPVPDEVLEATNNLKYNIVYNVNLCIDRENISDKHWIYFPEEDFIFHRIAFPMNFSPTMAPKAKSSIQAEISASEYKSIEESNIIDRVIKDLIKSEIIKSNDTIISKSIKILNPAYVIHDLEHLKNTKIIHTFLNKNNIFSCGRFGEWWYFNMDHSILSGKKAADAIIS